jgi:hypothetical protein
MKVFTLDDGRITEGAAVQKYSPCAGIEFPAIIIGENGRGRKLGILPVGGTEETTLLNATVGTTRRGGPKLLSSSITDEDQCCIVVFRSPMGFRGGNSHTGDRYHTPCENRGESNPYKFESAFVQQKEAPYVMVPHFKCPLCLMMFTKDTPHPADAGEEVKFHPWPGKNLVEGRIAQGDAGAMGSGTHIVAVMPSGVVFRVAYTGRRYDSPKAH